LSPSGAERAPPKNVGLQREIHNASRREAQGSGARWRDGAAEEQGRGGADAAAADGGRGRAEAEAGRSCSDRGAARTRRRMPRKARAGGRNVRARGDAAEVARFGSRDGGDPFVGLGWDAFIFSIIDVFLFWELSSARRLM